MKWTRSTASLAGLVFAASVWALAFPTMASAQIPGFAEITRPAAGEALSGVVTIYGTADHPAFVGYDLAFAYADNPTDTWFFLGEAVQVPVTDGRLGLWDTTEIADGDYLLRLRVWLQDGTALEAIVRGLRVRNQSPAETATPAPAETAAPPSTPTAVRPTLAAPTTVPPSSQSRAAGALASGVFTALTGLGLLALYSLTRAALRPRWAALRTRYFHWQDRRRRRVTRSRPR
ncbi:MAG: hypothetical protein AB1449_11945 [Chloroflexota bacterium]